MYGWLPDMGDTGWLGTQHDAPKPKTVLKSIVEARGPEAERLMEAIREREEAKTGKPHIWREDADWWTLVEGEVPKDRVIVKKYPKP